MGNPLRITDRLRSSTFKANQIIPNTRSFWYDARYRLTRATGRKHATVTTAGTLSAVSSPDPNDYDPYDYRYVYDAVGNFIKNPEYDAGRLRYKDSRIDLFNGDADEATSGSATAGNWQYDANGCCTKTPRHAELAYSFDSQPRYVDMGGGGEVHYFRHGDQRVVRMVKKTGVTGLSIYLGPFEYHTRDATTSYTKVTLHCAAHGRHAQAEVVLTGTDSDNLGIFFQHSDHLGSGQVLTKDDGTLLSQEEFFPYGRSSDRRDARNRYRYIGVERDEDTGLCMTGPRTYDPVTGRFLQGDPIAAQRGGWTPFHYSSSNPVDRLDKNGYQDSGTGESGPSGHQRLAALMSVADTWRQGTTSKWLHMDNSSQTSYNRMYLSKRQELLDSGDYAALNAMHEEIDRAWVAYRTGLTPLNEGFVLPDPQVIQGDTASVEGVQWINIAGMYMMATTDSQEERDRINPIVEDYRDFREAMPQEWLDHATNYTGRDEVGFKRWIEGASQDWVNYRDAWEKLWGDDTIRAAGDGSGLLEFGQAGNIIPMCEADINRCLTVQPKRFMDFAADPNGLMMYDNIVTQFRELNEIQGQGEGGDIPPWMWTGLPDTGPPTVNNWWLFPDHR